MNVVKIQEFTEEYGIQEQKSTKVKTEQGYYQSSRQGFLNDHLLMICPIE